MRAVAGLFILALGLAGCSSFGKKEPAKPPALPPQGPAPAWPGAGGPPPGSPAAAATIPAGASGILAGRVLDSYDRPPPPTFIQIVSAQEVNGSKAAPIEVATDNQGYFTIQGLQPGQHYQLIARTREGEAAKLAGTTWATPPNPRVLIYMSADLATSTTPPAPGAPSIPGRKPQGSSATEGNHESKPSSIRGPQPRAAELGAPIRLNDPNAPTHPERMTLNDRQLASNPVASIPTQGASLPVAPVPATSAATGRVPFCVLTGRHLDNFGLYDVYGRPWEYRSHTGRLVLIDFWYSTCIPCRHAIPHLTALQKTYGPYGLEVVGIACERPGPPPQEQARNIQGLGERLAIPYRLLMASGPNCPVVTQFGIDAFPTLVLLDESNQIIWRTQGLDSFKLQELTMIIRQRLGVR